MGELWYARSPPALCFPAVDGPYFVQVFPHLTLAASSHSAAPPVERQGTENAGLVSATSARDSRLPPALLMSRFDRNQLTEWVPQLQNLLRKRRTPVRYGMSHGGMSIATPATEPLW